MSTVADRSPGSSPRLSVLDGSEQPPSPSPSQISVMSTITEPSGSVRHMNLPAYQMDAPAFALSQLSLHNALSEVPTVLALSNSNVSDLAVLTLARALAHNTRITTLYLSGNHDISDLGATALADVVRKNVTLRHLFLRSTRITNEGALALLQALHDNPFSHLRRLDLRRNADVDDEVVDRIRDELDVHKLRSGLSSRATASPALDAELAAIADALRRNDPGVCDLAIQTGGDNGLLQFLVPVLPARSHLQTLKLSGSELTALGIKALASALRDNSALWELDVGGNPAVGDPGAIALAELLTRNSHLEILRMSSCGVGDAGAAALASALKVNARLLSFDVSRNADLPVDRIADALRVNQTLRRLVITGCRSGGEASGQAILEALKINPALVQLQMDVFMLPPAVKQSIFKSLARNQRRTNVDQQVARSSHHPPRHWRPAGFVGVIDVAHSDAGSTVAADAGESDRGDDDWSSLGSISPRRFHSIVPPSASLFGDLRVQIDTAEQQFKATLAELHLLRRANEELTEENRQLRALVEEQKLAHSPPPMRPSSQDSRPVSPPL